MTAFRLAGVLRMRRTLEERCEVRAAAAHRQVVAADQLADRRHQELRRAALGAADTAAFTTHVTAIGFRTSSARDADHAAEDARSNHRSRMDELVQASMAVSALERLEERVHEAAREAERTREVREIDDLVTARFAVATERGNRPMTGHAPWTSIVPVPARVSEIRVRLGTRANAADATAFESTLSDAIQSGAPGAPPAATLAATAPVGLGRSFSSYSASAPSPFATTSATGRDVAPARAPLPRRPLRVGRQRPGNRGRLLRLHEARLRLARRRAPPGQHRAGNHGRTRRIAGRRPAGRPARVRISGRPRRDLPRRRPHGARRGDGERGARRRRVPPAHRDPPAAADRRASVERPAPDATAYETSFATAGARYGVEPTLLSAIARAESGYDPNAVSRSGALGMMQFMPSTAAGLGIDPLDPGQAIDGAARYLAQQLAAFGSVELALAADNAGPGAVARHGAVPPYAETQSYVRRVLAYRDEALAMIGASA